MDRMTNWAGNVVYSAERVHRPGTVGEVAEIVTRAAKVKAVATRHTFGPVGDTAGELVSVEKLNRVVGLDKQRGTVTAEAGITYAALCEWLHERGYAVENLPSLPHVSVGGAVQTGTHGSGTGNLATAVVGLEIVDGRGRVREVSREETGETFDGMVVALGLLGVVTKVTLNVRKGFLVRQDIYEDVPLEGVLGEFARLMACGYSVSLFTRWQGGRVSQVWVKREVKGETVPLSFEFLKGRLAERQMHPIASMSAENCTVQGVPGPAHERLCHFRPDREPSAGGAELQSEYFVGMEDAVEALKAVAEVGERLRDVLLVSEVRTVKADTLWMSPHYRRESVGIHFTWRHDVAAVTAVLERIVEPALAPFRPRPHWGKMFRMEPMAVRSQYERLGKFVALCREMDPDRKFANAFAERYVVG